MDATFEIYDHTADAGIRLRGPTPAAIVEIAPAGLYAAIGDLHAAAPGPTQQATFDADGREYLLRDFLADLLVRFETEGELANKVRVLDFDDRRLAVEYRVAPVDTDRSRFSREVKAITYHDLRFEQVADGYEATLIIDI